MISKGIVVGTVEEVTPIDEKDPIWIEPETSPDSLVRRCPSHPSEDRESGQTASFTMCW